jgi:kynurenine formamidase
LTLQYSTQWDSLAHMGQMFDADGDGVPEMVFYNGFRAVEDVAGPVDYRADVERDTGGHAGARALGIERMAERCVQGRGVMIDFAAHFGESPVLIGYDELMRVMDADRVEVEQGDMVCMRTGFDRVLLGMGKSPDAARLAQTGAALDGRDDALLKWITDSGVVALIADNPAVERLPNLCCDVHAFAFHPLHDHCLFRLGVYLGELWLLSDLADWLRQAGRSRFLLTAPPLRLPGAVGSPATPVATV